MTPPTMTFNNGDTVYLKKDMSFDNKGQALALAWQGLYMPVPSPARTANTITVNMSEGAAFYAGASGLITHMDHMNDGYIEVLLEDHASALRVLRCTRWFPHYFSREPVLRVDQRPTAWARVLEVD